MWHQSSSTSSSTSLPIEEEPSQLPSSRVPELLRLERPILNSRSGSTLPLEGPVVVIPTRDAAAAVSQHALSVHSPAGSTMVLPFIAAAAHSVSAQTNYGGIMSSNHLSTASVTGHRAAAAGRGGGGVSAASDQRPIRPSPNGQYNLTFFDGRSEYERVTVLAQQQQEGTRLISAAPPPPPPLGSLTAGPSSSSSNHGGGGGQRLLFLQHLSDDTVSDEVFAQEFSYERLLALDASVPPRPRKGLSAYHLARVLRPLLRQQVDTNRGGGERGATVDDRPPSCEECAICLEALIGETAPFSSSSSQEEEEQQQHPLTTTTTSAATTILTRRSLSSESDGDVGAHSGAAPNRSHGSLQHALPSLVTTTTTTTTPTSTVVAMPPAEGGMVRLRCGHWFHKPCVVQWLSEQTTCPVCRKDVLQMEEDVDVERAVRDSAAPSSTQ